MLNKRIRRLFSSPLWWQHMWSDSDFLLRIGALSKYQSKKVPKSTYSPPGYGLPPGRLEEEELSPPKKQSRYGLFLFPGRISKWFLRISLSLPFLIFSPFLIHEANKYCYGIYFYVPAIMIYWALSLGIYYWAYYKRMSPVLSKAWEKWPPAAYHLFLSVPHKITLEKQDKNKDEFLYWQPDVHSNMSRQTTVFAKNTQSLQEVILNFSIFEFFFQRPEKKTQSKIEMLKNESDKQQDDQETDVINGRNWFSYFFTPIWVSYALILFFLFFMTALPVKALDQHSNQAHSWFVLANLPYNFLPVIVIWFVFSLFYIQHIISGLEDLHNKVREGVFDSHLERVPQAILQELANIPKEQHINEGIQYIKRAMGWLSSIALLGFLGLLEVLSQGYGSQAMYFYFYI